MFAPDCHCWAVNIHWECPLQWQKSLHMQIPARIVHKVWLSRAGIFVSGMRWVAVAQRVDGEGGCAAGLVESCDPECVLVELAQGVVQRAEGA